MHVQNLGHTVTHNTVKVLCGEALLSLMTKINNAVATTYIICINHSLRCMHRTEQPPLATIVIQVDSSHACSISLHTVINNSVKHQGFINKDILITTCKVTD